MRPPTTSTAYEGRLVRLAVVTLALLVTFAFSQWVVPIPHAQAANPYLTADPVADDMWGNDFTPDTLVTLTVNGAEIDESPVMTDGSGNFDLDHPISFDLAAGDTVVAADGFYTKTLTITTLAVESINVLTDVVSGTAPLGADVYVNSGPGDAWRIVNAADGTWTTDFGDPGDDGVSTYDIQFGDGGSAQDCDDENDCTHIEWNAPYPRFEVYSEGGQIWASGFEPNSTITITISGQPPSDHPTDEWGNFDGNNFGLTFDVPVGAEVTITDGTHTKVHVVTNLAITSVDEATNTVTGTADVDDTIDVWHHHEGPNNLQVTANGSGVWTADFTGMIDFQPGTNGNSGEMDEDGDQTYAFWQVPNTRMDAEPLTDNVSGNEFAPNGTVQLTIDRGLNEIFSAPYPADEWGNWGTNNPLPIDLQAGDVVVADDGTTLKTHTVTDLAITDKNITTEIISGTTSDGAEVCVDVSVPDWGQGTDCVTPAGGSWSIDTATPAFDNYGLEPGVDGNAYQCDAEQNCTWIYWWVPDPRFTVDPNSEGLWVNDFAPGGSVTVTLMRDSTPVVVPGSPFATDDNGSFGHGFDPSQLDLLAGDVVEVTDGASLKNHTITALTVDSIDQDENTVSGTALPGSQVWVDLHGYWGVGRFVTAGPGDGSWTADFDDPGGEGQTADLTPGENGYASQCDADNDCTQVDWHVRAPRIDVDSATDNVWGNDFAPNSAVTITVGSGDPYGPYPTDLWGNFGTDQPLPEDLGAGVTVAVTDGTDTVIHVVLPLLITAVDTESETVHGTADPNARVDVWVHDVGDVSRTVYGDGAGTWTADFTQDGISDPNDRGTADLVLGSNGNSNTCDAENNCTYASWRVADPYIGASIIHEEVWANDFPDEPEGQRLYYRLDDPGTLGIIDFESDMPLIVDGSGTQAGDRSFGRYDVQAGWVYTVRNRPFDQPLDGGFERVLNLSHIVVRGVDGDLDIITGYADPSEGPDLCVWSQDNQLCYGDTGLDWDQGTGDWTADFGSIGSDVAPGHWNSASQFDFDGDETHYWWNLPPWVVVELAEEDEAGDPLWPDAVRAEQWTGPVVTLTIERGGTELHNEAWTVTGDEQYTFQLPGLDIEPGDVVTLSDATDTKAIVVEPLYIDQINYSGDVPPNTVYATAAPYRNVRVSASASVGGWWAERWVNADLAGDLMADFGVPGSGWREQWTAEFGGAEGLGRHMWLEVYDDDNDRVETRTCEGVPRIEVARSDGRVDAYDFPEGATVTVTVTGVAGEFSATAERNPDNPCETIASIDVGQPIPEGADVTADDDQGTPPVTHTVIFLTIDFIDQDADTLTGTAPAGAQVLVQAGHVWRYPIACDDTAENPCDGAEPGTWVANFAVQGSEPGEEELFDLGPGANGIATVLDEFGNTTSINWRISAAHFSVDPTSEMLWANEFLPNTQVDVTVNGTEVPGGPFFTDGGGNFDTSQYGWDPENPRSFEADDIVVVSDGETTKDHTITALIVDLIDPDNNIVAGSASPGAQIWVDVHNSPGDTGRTVTATDPDGDGVGTWSADFDQQGDGGGTWNLEAGTQGYAEECDIDNDCTQIQWRVLAPSFWVYPDGDFLLGQDMEPDGSVSVTVDPFDGEAETFGPFGTDEWGNFDIGALPIDIRPGDLVTVSDGTTVKHHTVTPLVVTAASDVDDTVGGFATGGAEVQVLASGSGFDWRVDYAAPDGSWTMYFNQTGPNGENPRDLLLGDNGIALECDTEHDCTAANWDLRFAQFQVDPVSEQLWANGFAGVQLFLSRGETEESAEPLPGGPFWTDGNGDLGTGWDPNELDIAPGDRIWVSDGETTKDHIITGLTVDFVDAATNVVSGTAAPGSEVWVDIHGSPGDIGRTVIAVDDAEDGLDIGYWSSDFDEPGDGGGTATLEPGTGGYAQQCDIDEDCTQINWQVRNPTFTVGPDHDSVWGQGWVEGHEVEVTIEDGDPNTPPFVSDPALVERWGPNPWDVGFGADLGYDIMPDDLVTVADVTEPNTDEKQHVVTPLTVEGIDEEAETVFGTALVGSQVNVSIWGTDSEHHADRTVTVGPDDSAGHPFDGLGWWTASFGEPGPEDWEDVTRDLQPHTAGAAMQHDDDGDATQIDFGQGGEPQQPGFTVRTSDQLVQGEGWPEGVQVTFTVTDPASGDTYSATRGVEQAEWDPEQTIVEFRPLDEEGFEVLPGFETEMTDGDVIKSHTVRTIQITAIDLDADTVSGIATPNSWVTVHIHETEVTRDVSTDQDGNFFADFANPGDEEHEQETWDIDVGTAGEVFDSDEDGDATQIDWEVPQPPAFAVNPDQDYTDGDGWFNGPPILTFDTDEDPTNGVLGTVEIADYNPEEGHFEQFIDFDIEPGQFVTATDGVETKTHWVTGLDVMSIDESADTVSGVAEPLTLVEVEINAPLEGMVWEHLTFQFGPGRLDRNPDSWNEHLDFRRAVAHAIDRQALVGAIPSAGYAIDSYVDAYLPALSGHAWARYDYNQTMAESLIDGLCTSLGRDCTTNPPVAVFTTTGAQHRQIIADQLEAMLGVVGIQVVVELEDAATYFGPTINAGTFDLGEWAWLESPTYEGLVVTHEWFDPEQRWSQNYYRWGTPDSSVIDAFTERMAELVGLMHETGETELLEDYFAEAEQILADQVVFIPLYVKAETFEAEGAPRVFVTANEFGDWTADFSAIFDIVPGTEGVAGQYDDDGDETRDNWRLRGLPEFGVTATHDWVEGYDFEGETITVTFDDNNDPGDGVLYEESFGVDPGQYNWLHVIDDFDIEAGQYVTVTDGIITKATWVSPIEITSVDVDNWIVSGIADPGTDPALGFQPEIDTFAVHPDVGGVGGHIVLVDLDGYWTLDLDEVFDPSDRPSTIPPGMLLGGGQRDEDGDRTVMFWDPALLEGHVYLDGDPLAGTAVFSTLTAGSRFTCTDAAGYFSYDASVVYTLIDRWQVVATGRAGSPDCTNPNFLDGDGKPLLHAFASGPFDLQDGYEYVSFDVERAAAYQDVIVEEFDGAAWVPVDELWVHAYDLSNGDFVDAFGADPGPERYADIMESGIGQLEYWGTGWPEAPGTAEMRYPHQTDVLILVEYVDGTILGATTGSSEFVDRGDGVLVGPTIVFPNKPPVITDVAGPMVPLLIGTPATITATFTDPNVHDAHTASFDWDDGHVTDGEVAGWTATAMHTYAAAGVYEVTVTVTDAGDLADTETFRFVVIYDPADGFVTGGGWTHPNPSSHYPGVHPEDKVNLGFNVKYLTGSTEPQGEMNVQLGELHVHSDSIGWLVITIENEAYFSGVATIGGGADLYPFRVNVFDGDDDILPDRFEMLVYTPGADPYHDAPLYHVIGDLQGGQVKIHKK